MAQDKYIIGQGFAPEWCRRFLTPYQKRDGTTGYLLYGRWRDFELVKGDMLLIDDGKIKVRKGGTTWQRSVKEKGNSSTWNESRK